MSDFVRGFYDRDPALADFVRWLDSAVLQAEQQLEAVGDFEDEEARAITRRQLQGRVATLAEVRCQVEVLAARSDAQGRAVVNMRDAIEWLYDAGYIRRGVLQELYDFEQTAIGPRPDGLRVMRATKTLLEVLGA